MLWQRRIALMHQLNIQSSDIHAVKANYINAIFGELHRIRNAGISHKNMAERTEMNQPLNHASQDNLVLIFKLRQHIYGNIKRRLLKALR